MWGPSLHVPQIQLVSLTRGKLHYKMTLTLRNKYQITLWVTVEEELAIMHLFSSKGWHYINYNAYAVRQHINEGHLSSPMEISDRSQGSGEIHSSEHYITNPAMDYAQHAEYTTLKSASESLVASLTSHEVSQAQVGRDFIPPVGAEIVYRDSGEYLDADRNVGDVNEHGPNTDTNTNYAIGNEKGVEDAQLQVNYERVSVEPTVFGMNNTASTNEQGNKDQNGDKTYIEGNRGDLNAQLHVNYEKSSNETSYGANNVVIVEEQTLKNSNEESNCIKNETIYQLQCGNGGAVCHESNKACITEPVSNIKYVNKAQEYESNHERTNIYVQNSNPVSSYGIHNAVNVDRNNSVPDEYHPETIVPNYAGKMKVNSSGGLIEDQGLSRSETELKEVTKQETEGENMPMENVSSLDEPVKELMKDDVDNPIKTEEYALDESNVSDHIVTETSSIATSRQKRKTAAKAQSVIKSVTGTKKKRKSVAPKLEKRQSGDDSLKETGDGCLKETGDDNLKETQVPEKKPEIPMQKIQKKEIIKNKKSQSECPILLEEDKKLTEMSLMLVNACDDDPFMCCLCNRHFNDVQQFKDHATEKCLKELLFQKDPPVFKCKDCGQHYWQAFTLVRHRLSQVCKPGKKVDGILTCEHCGKTYPTRRQTDFTLHVMMHHDYKPHVCDVCGKKFMRWTSLRDHKRKHSGERPYKCNYCDLTFTTGSHQRNHELLKHIEVPRRFVCEKCGAAFKFSGGLSTHIKEVHTEEKKFVCNTCGRQFKRRGSLTEHFKTHSDVKDKVCEICGKAFYRRSHLNKHAQRHTNNRKHGCEDCGKRFFTKQSLEVHQRIHSGDKPFACKFCTYKSTSNGNLKKHVLAVHADVVIINPFPHNDTF